MYTIACQGIQEHREGSHEGLTFTSGHLGNLSLMEYHTTKQLHVVVNHLPFQVIAASRPVVVVDGLVTVDGDEVLSGIGSQLPIEVCGCDDGLLVLGKPFGSLFHNGEHLRHHLIEGFLVDVEDFFLNLVYLCEDVCTFVDGRILDSAFQFGYTGSLLSGLGLYLFTDLLRTLTQRIIIQLLNLW